MFFFAIRDTSLFSVFYAFFVVKILNPRQSAQSGAKSYLIAYSSPAGGALVSALNPYKTPA